MISTIRGEYRATDSRLAEFIDLCGLVQANNGRNEETGEYVTDEEQRRNNRPAIKARVLAFIRSLIDIPELPGRSFDESDIETRFE